MRFNNRLDLNLLVALDHLLNLKSVSGAAEKMHVTQSTMSSALQRLRDYFGDDLLVKIGRRMELTPRAEALKDSVRDLLVRIEWTIESTSEFDPGQSTRCFNILVSDYTLAVVAPAILARCARLAPEVRFQFHHQVHSPERLLERGDVDLLIIPHEFTSRQNPSEVILEEEFSAIVWSEGKYATGDLTLDDFNAASHVVMQPAFGAQSLESRKFEELGIRRRIDVTTYNFTTIPHLVAGTDRIATLHRRLALLASKLLPIRVVPLPIPLPPMRQAAQWHRYRSSDAGLMWLLDQIRAETQLLRSGS
jgi:DNA-binding transcriptional LysR family regulator